MFDLMEFVRKPKSSEVISNIINCSLIYPNITRWNSLYDSISQLIKHKAKLNTLTRDLGLKYQFNETDKLFDWICFINETYRLCSGLSTKRTKFLLWPFNSYFIFIEKSIAIIKGTTFVLHFQVNRSYNNLIRKTIQTIFWSLPWSWWGNWLASCFHPTFKLRWIPEYNEIMKNRIKNLCISITEKYLEKSSHTESSVDNVDKWGLFNIFFSGTMFWF